MNVEIYSCSRVLLKLLSSAEVFRGSSADLPRIFRGPGKPDIWDIHGLMRKLAVRTCTEHTYWRGRN